MTESIEAGDGGQPPDKPDRRSQLARRVDSRVGQLQAAYLNDVASAVAALARLRHAAGRPPGADPAAWAETLDLVDDLGTDTAEPTAQEWAVHLALTLYSLHQQSQRERPMHRRGPSLGRATRELAQAKGEETGQAVLRRFHMLGTAATLPEVAHHARSLITQLRSADIALDYGLLTDHLVKLQHPITASSVRLAWGRDYYRTRRTNITPPTQGDPA